MSKKKMTLSAVVLLVSLLLVSSALAMSSANYKLDWFTPMTGGGGGPAASANYAINLTIGQTAIGASASANYRVGLGYWYGLLPGGRLHLPLILR